MTAGSKPVPSSWTASRSPSACEPASVMATVARLGVLDHVVERLLGDAVERGLDLEGRPVVGHGALDADRQPDPALDAGGVGPERLDQAVLLEVGRAAARR